MVAKLFTKPFGTGGDKTPIPNNTQVDGTVSYETGFGADYERQLGVDPAAKNISRQAFNELMFDATTSLQELQAGVGTSPYSLALAQSLPGGGYPKGALIPRLAGDGFWLCTVAANTSNPDTGGVGWVQVAMPQGSFYAIDTGVANAYSCAFSPALIARSEAQPLAVRIKFTNTGASTINDGLGTVPLVGTAQAPLQGGEVAANGVALLQWVAAIASYVVVYATGGAVQVAGATKSLQVVNAGQIQAQSVTAFTTTGTATAQVLTPIPAISGYAVGQRFSVTFNVASGLNPTINVSGRGAISAKQYDGSGAKVAAVWAAGQISDIVYDGTDWVMLDTNASVQSATTTDEGIVRLATQPQVDAGTDPAAAVTSATLATRLAAALSGKLNASGGSIAGSLNIDSPQSFSAPALSVSTSVTGSSLSLIRITGPNTGILLSHQNNTSTLSVSNISGAVAAISAGDVLSNGSLCHTASSFMKPVAGQWLSIAGALTLPPGGTWAFQFLNFNNNGSFLGGSVTGLVAGGTQIGATTSVGFAWRYQ